MIRVRLTLALLLLSGCLSGIPPVEEPWAPTDLSDGWSLSYTQTLQDGNVSVVSLADGGAGSLFADLLASRVVYSQDDGNAMEFLWADSGPWGIEIGSPVENPSSVVWAFPQPGMGLQVAELIALPHLAQEEIVSRVPSLREAEWARGDTFLRIEKESGNHTWSVRYELDGTPWPARIDVTADRCQGSPCIAWPHPAVTLERTDLDPGTGEPYQPQPKPHRDWMAPTSVSADAVPELDPGGLATSLREAIDWLRQRDARMDDVLRAGGRVIDVRFQGDSFKGETQWSGVVAGPQGGMRFHFEHEDPAPLTLVVEPTYQVTEEPDAVLPRWGSEPRLPAPDAPRPPHTCSSDPRVTSIRLLVETVWIPEPNGPQPEPFGFLSIGRLGPPTDLECRAERDFLGYDLEQAGLSAYARSTDPF